MSGLLYWDAGVEALLRARWTEVEDLRYAPRWRGGPEASLFGDLDGPGRFPHLCWAVALLIIKQMIFNAPASWSAKS